MKRAGTAALLLLLTACVRPTPVAPLEPDLSLLRGYSWEDQAAEPYEAPYLVRFAAGPYSLTFVATAHRESPKSDTFRLIADALSADPPSFVILEGFTTADGPDPAWIVDWAAACWETDHCGEPAYAAVLAQRAGVPFVGGEPTDPEILAYIQSQGYAAEDLVGFYAVRAVSQWQRQGTLDANPAEQLERYLASVAEDLGHPELATSYTSFCAWYATRRGRPFDPERHDPDDLAPILADNASYIQTLSHWVGVARETHLVGVIVDALNAHHDVMVIYGAGHLVKERPLLEALLGEPILETQTLD